MMSVPVDTTWLSKCEAFFGDARLSCNRGAASPTPYTQKKLLAASGGYCQNPKCSTELFMDAHGASVHIAEMAHVFAASNEGPRAQKDLSKAARGTFENLLLLCANCHTMVDKAPTVFTDSILIGWKRDHMMRLKATFGVVAYESRFLLRSAITPLLLENRVIFDRYGPHIDAAADPESGAAERWKRKMLSRILPNNGKIIMMIDANRSLLTPAELNTSELFRQHVDDLYSYHIEGTNEDASRFPAAMTLIGDE